MGLVPQSYFQDVRNHMIRAGFTLISQVAIDNQDLEYHVRATIARSTRIFFHVTGMSVIAALSYDENDYFEREVIRSHWRIDLYTQRSGDAWADPGEAPSGFRSFGGSWNTGTQHDVYEQELADAIPMEPATLVAAVMTLRERAEPFVTTGPFKELQVTDFPPHYTFKKSEDLFWSRFDTTYFRKVVRRPWGSGDY